MTNDEFEFLLFDRLEKIKQINEEYDLENNAYISFSGGKDSTVLHYLLDLALPNNKIPRVFINTGIEYSDVRKFVQELALTDERIIILNSGVNIKQMLDKEGYPFKSKQHSHNWSIYSRFHEKINPIVEYLNYNKEKQLDYDYIHNLEKGTKTIVKYVFGTRERERDCYVYLDCP